MRLPVDTTARLAALGHRCLPDEYARVRDDSAGTLPAVGVVVGATLLAALGGLLWARFGATPPSVFSVDIPRFFVRSVLFGSLIQVGMWFCWVSITWFCLSRIYLLPDIRWSRLLRTMGGAFAPMAVQLLLIFPVLEFPVGLIALGATAGCSVLAVQAATEAGPSPALRSTLAGFAVFALVLGILGHGSIDLAPGIFALDPNALSVGLKLNVNSGR